MSERKRQTALSRLEEIPAVNPVELRFRDGSQKTVYLYDIIEKGNTSQIQYATSPPSPDAFYGSKMGPGDWLPTVDCNNLGYVKDMTTGRKVSMMPFQTRAA